MSDVETNTEWSHLLGRAMSGKLKGYTLEPLITDMVTWSVWRKQHPDTTVLNMSRTSHNYSRDFYRDPSKFVFGFEVGGQAFALPMEKMVERSVHSFSINDEPLLATFDNEGAVTHLFRPTIDGTQFDFDRVDDRHMKDRQTGSTWSTTSGKAIDGPSAGDILPQRVGIMSFRKAWQNFFPDSKDVEF